jgi:transcriptional regulator with PAS, ATPase and Fis domain
MICAPIKSATTHGITGAIQILNKRLSGTFTKEDMSQLEEVAKYLALSIENIIINQEILRIFGLMNQEYERFDREFSFDALFIAESQAMREVLDLTRLVSKTPVNVLLQGENGTGKELIARMIHEGSDRREKPFVAVNCASIPEHLMESEFFGYEKGAFTGADHSKKGRFEEADGGTLMLDEIADMPLTIQPKFLRAIQEGEGTRLGSNKLIKYDFRIISATNKDLPRELEEGRFREDLFFRLFSVEINLPPLRDRKEDIVPLSLAFLEEISRRFNKKVAGFSPEILNLFEDFGWPGNVRQLRSEVERLVALTPEGTVIGPEKCSRELLAATPISARKMKSSGSLSIPDQVMSLEMELIEKALEESRGNRVKAAEALGITRQGLHKKMKRYEIDTKK